MEDNIQNQEQQYVDSQQYADSRQEFISIYQAQKITILDIKEHLTVPVISIIAHVVILTICATLVTMEAPPERDEIEVSIQEVDIKEIEKIPEPPQPEEVQEVADQTVEIDRPSVAATDVNVEKANPVITGDATYYSHPIVTYAISEAYALTKIPILEPLVNKAAAVIVSGQNQVGGFNYKFDNATQRSDLSFGGWCMQALKAAFAAGSTAPGLEAAIEKSIKWTSGPQHVPGQGFAYEITGAGVAAPGSSGTQVTAVGTLCLQLLGAGKLPEVKEGIGWLERCVNVCNWKEPKGWDLYRWYYQTQAYFQFYEGKEKQWKDWNRMFTTELLKNQKSDGRWDSPALDMIAAGGNPPAVGGGGESFRGIDGPVYGTSLCCLMLEVYYRYLPTFKVTEAKAGTATVEPAAGGREKKKDDGSLVIE